MRMWNVNPKWMCRQHLLGEHLECHMFVSCLNKGMSLEGYAKSNKLEVTSLRSRHDALVAEMSARGYCHFTPLPEFSEFELGHINSEMAWLELSRRCEACRERRASVECCPP